MSTGWGVVAKLGRHSPSWFFPATYHVPGLRGARGGSAAGGVPWGCCPESAPSSAGLEESRAVVPAGEHLP